MAITDDLYASTLTIDLDAVAANYALLSERLLPSKALAGAAVKADGYGLGVKPVARALWAAGCRDFFVAHPAEGVAVRQELADARIHVLNGPIKTAIDDYIYYDLIPVLNSLGDIALWQEACRSRNRRFKADVHIDTGMCRLGLDLGETSTLLSDADDLLDGIDVQLFMTHLASADDIESPQSAQQLSLFKSAYDRLQIGQPSLCNSSGIFLGEAYHYAVARPGIALYGGNPTPHTTNPMANPVTLTTRLLQVRDVGPGENVGYGASYDVGQPMKVATVAIGYADGFHRIGSNIGFATIEGHKAPIIGRVSMDLITLDVTTVPEHLLDGGAIATFVGPERTPDDLARHWQTIPYEVLTGLGRRYRRVYTGIGA